MTETTKPLTKREMDFMHPAVILRMEIHCRNGGKNNTWNGDRYLPVKVGIICESLISNGFLERVKLGLITDIRATQKGRGLICRKCHGTGRKHNNSNEVTGDCPHCYRGMKESA